MSEEQSIRVDAPADELPGRRPWRPRRRRRVRRRRAGRAAGGRPGEILGREAGAVRTEALLKSYRRARAQARHDGRRCRGDDDPEGRERLHRALGVPASPSDYRIEARARRWSSRPRRSTPGCIEAGFTQEQAQLVYDLAAEQLLPVIEDAVGELARPAEAERWRRISAAPGAWRKLARQIKTWGEANLAGDVYGRSPRATTACSPCIR